MVQERSDNVTQVKSTTSGKQVKFKGIDMKSADDWVILDALNYDDATLISVDAGIEQKINRAYEKDSSRPIYNTAFHFGLDDEVPGCPRDCKLATAGATSQTQSSSSTTEIMMPLRSNVSLPA
jgi:hypothetical protein